MACTRLSNKQFALVSAYMIGRGIEVRSYGTYDTIEEVTGRFAEFRGGCQLSLIAMELLPDVVMETLQKVVTASVSNKDVCWKGFITVTGEPKFSHINDVINISPEALWNPVYWWVLYHEIGHVIVEKISILLKTPGANTYQQNRGYDAENELVEYAAEIIGYELGFFGDYNLYLKLLWDYLSNLKNLEDIPLVTYAIRSFIVELYAGYFRSDIPNKISKTDFFNFDVLYEKFIDHLNAIEHLLGRQIFHGKQFIASQNIKIFSDLYLFCSYLFQDVKTFKLRPRNALLNTKNTKAVRDDLLNGRIWWDKIECPQAVLYHLFNNGNINFNTRMATLLSFWNQQTSKCSQGTAR